jgi:4-diphosphocytidyl-2-C-methyl-D-erythritol kinase
VKIEANAKINLSLDILGKREDGFHEVAMIMQSVDLHDSLALQKVQSGIHITSEAAGLPLDQSNLIWRAAQLMQETYSLGGIEVGLVKRIPMAAGLAGGSADAAAVLRGMNELYGLGKTLAELAGLGAAIGSDVPFCVLGGTMLATGRGEVLSRLPDMPAAFVVLAKPPIAVSTAWAYQQYDASAAEAHPDNIALQRDIAAQDGRSLARKLSNVLESVTIKKYGVIAEYKEMMLAAGAAGVLMSGSGPTVFALAEDRLTAEKIMQVMRDHTDAAVFMAMTTGRN